MRLGLHEIVKIVSSCADEESKIQTLRQHESGALRKILRYAYDSRIKWIIPETPPPYKPLPSDQLISSEMMLIKEARTLYLFAEGDVEFNPNVSKSKREMMYVELLEAVHPEDAKLLLAVREGHIPGIDRDVVAAAFPNMLPALSVAAQVVNTVKKTLISPEKRERNRLYAKAKRLREKEKKLAAKAAAEQQKDA